MTDFHPIANIRLLRKTFAYLVLNRAKRIWSYRSQKNNAASEATEGLTEEHLLTANMVVNKTLLAGVLLWLTSLDLAKAFDQVRWDALWTALRGQGVSDHVGLMLQQGDVDQTGQVMSNNDAVLQATMPQWRSRNGFDLGDNRIHFMFCR